MKSDENRNLMKSDENIGFHQISTDFISFHFLIFFDIFSQSKIFLIFFWKQYLSLLSRQCAVDYFRNHMKTECLLSRQTVFPKLKYVVFP